MKEVLMVSKRNVFTAAGIILSFVIAIGGWVLTGRLIDIESERLLSASMPFLVDIPIIESMYLSDDIDNDPNARLHLSEYEMVSILQNWGSLGQRRLHEPVAGQISMEQAIASGREGLDFLYEQSILSEEALVFYDVRAYLGQNIIPNNEQFLSLEYSYWNVGFANERLIVYMTINAATGQVWKIEVEETRSIIEESTSHIMLKVNNGEIMNALAAFISNLGIHPDDNASFELHPLESTSEFVSDQTGAVYFGGYALAVDSVLSGIGDRRGDAVIAHQSFADGSASAIISAVGMLTPDGILHFSRFNISLRGCQ